MAENAISNLIANRNAIRKLMAMDSNGKMDSMLRENINNGTVSYGEDGVSYTPKVKTQQQQVSERVVVNENVIKKSKLPQSVLESFKEDPGTPFSLSAPPPQTSVLDGIELPTLQEVRNERAISENTQQQQVVNQAVDYSLLRTIINEAVQENVKKYVSAMTKKLISEGVKSEDTVQAVKFGDKFSFITENGDVYEATLKFKTNLNEQTKKK